MGPILPLHKQPAPSPEGYEISVATNYLGHFLPASLMQDDLPKAASPSPDHARHTVTANSEEFGGSVPIPAPADVRRRSDCPEQY